MAKIKNRIGEENYNNFGSKMIIIKQYQDYDGKRNEVYIDIFFPEYNWIYKHGEYHHFKLGEIKCPYEARRYNKGYMGEGKYNSKDDEKAYGHWEKMLERCYKSNKNNNPTYVNCEVEDYLLNFQHFAEWYYNNFYQIENEKMCLDKDILCKGNKVYSRETCIFVPDRINKMFEKRRNGKNKSLPCGVVPSGNKYQCRCNNQYLGTFKTSHEAFLIYKINKELVIESVANEYKDKIPNKLYEAMINYKVEEND